MFSKINANKKNVIFVWYLENKEHKYKWYTFRQQHTSGYNQRRVGYYLISTDLRGFIKKPNDLVVFSTDPSIIIFFL